MATSALFLKISIMGCWCTCIFSDNLSRLSSSHSCPVPLKHPLLSPLYVPKFVLYDLPGCEHLHKKMLLMVYYPTYVASLIPSVVYRQSKRVKGYHTQEYFTECFKRASQNIISFLNAHTTERFAMILKNDVTNQGIYFLISIIK